METRKIGSLDASVVGLGCNNFGGRIDEGATSKVVDAALEVGVTFLILPIFMAARRAKSFWDVFSKAAATKWFLRLSSAPK